jgi:hypothetical protein
MSHPIRVHSNGQPTRPIPIHLKQQDKKCKKTKNKTKQKKNREM